MEGSQTRIDCREERAVRSGQPERFEIGVTLASTRPTEQEGRIRARHQVRTLVKRQICRVLARVLSNVGTLHARYGARRVHWR